MYIVSCLILVSFISITIPNVSADGSYILAEIRLNPGKEIQEATVGPVINGTVVFTGTLECKLYSSSPQDILVNLTATSENGWAIKVEPPIIIFDPEKDSNIPFNVTVIVPAKTSFFAVHSP